MMKNNDLYKLAIVFLLVLGVSGCDKKESEVQFKTVEENTNHGILAKIGLEPQYVYSKDSIASLTDKKIIEFIFLAEEIDYSVDSSGRIFFKPHFERTPYTSVMDFLWQKTKRWKEIKTENETVNIPSFSCKVDTTEKIKLEGISFYQTRTVEDSIMFFRDDLGFVLDSNSESHGYTDNDLNSFYKYVDFVSIESKCQSKKHALLKFRFYQEVPASFTVKVEVYGLSKNVNVQIESMKKGYFNK